MGKNKIKKQMHSESAVSEILGTILLFAMAIALFSVLYISIIPMDSVQSSTSSNIIGYIQDGNIILEHHGGSSVTTESYLRFNIGGSMSIVNISSTFLHDTNNNSKWDIGEKIVYSAEIGGLQVETFVINEPSNSVIFSATLQQGSVTSQQSGDIITLVNSLNPYALTKSPLTINATSTGASPDNITLWYRYSTDNSTWKLQNASVPVVESFEYYRGSGTTCSIAKPSGVQSGDLLVVLCTTDGTGSALSGPSGFTILHSESQNNGQTTASWWKKAGGSEPSSYSITWSGTERYVGSCTRISGADTDDPVDVSDSNDGSSGTVTSPSITTTVDNTLILRFHGIDDDDQGNDYSGDNPIGTIELYAYGSLGSGECSGACSYKSQISSGSTGTAAWTFSNNEGWAAFSVAIKPESSATGVNWTKWPNGANPDTSSPWTWAFNFPNTTGYYEFYSIGKKSGLSDETAPSTADAICKYTNNTVISNINIRVETGNDDAEELVSDGNMYRDSSDLELINDQDYAGGNQEIGMRFNSIEIPQGSTIISANLTFVIDEKYTDDTDLNIFAHDTDHSSTFTNTNYNITSREKTSNSVQWNSLPSPNVGETLISPDIITVIQEIIDRAGWSSGNSLTIIINGTGRRTVESYNGVSQYAPLLSIKYLKINN